MYFLVLKKPDERFTTLTVGKPYEVLLRREWHWSVINDIKMELPRNGTGLYPFKRRSRSGCHGGYSDYPEFDNPSSNAIDPDIPEILDPLKDTLDIIHKKDILPYILASVTEDDI